jgi:hypothetical protein
MTDGLKPEWGVWISGLGSPYAPKWWASFSSTAANAPIYPCAFFTEGEAKAAAAKFLTSLPNSASVEPRKFSSLPKNGK